jgi:hypothetical protein
MKLIGSFVTSRKFKIFVEGEFDMPRKIAVVVPQGYILAPVLHCLYINDTLAAPENHLSLFVDDTCIYATKKYERHVLCKLPRALTAVK